MRIACLTVSAYLQIRALQREGTYYPFATTSGGPGITRSDLLVINKTDLAPHVGADLGVMARDAKKMRGERAFCFTNLRTGEGLEQVAAFICRQGLLDYGKEVVVG